MLKERHKAWVDEVRQVLERADLCKFRKDDAARALGVTKIGLHQRLRRAGTSWMAELNRERVLRLQDALDDAPGSEKQFLAELLGFRWAVSFDNFFKKHMGCTLWQWRNGKAQTD